MKGRRDSLAGFAFAALIVLVAAFLVRLTLHRPPAVTLPAPGDTESGGAVVPETRQDAVRRVEVTPETVQRVIERLARPENYSRTITIERFWPGGSGVSTASVRAAEGWLRVDAGENEETARHVINGGGSCWVWYGAGERVFTGAAALTGDEEQGIPSYEDVLLLDVSEIAAADYRAFEGLECIYVETKPDEAGYTQRYWVCVEDGLLAAAERASGEDLVYRMTALSAQLGGVDGQAFRLPDGEYLLRPDGEQPDTADTEESEGGNALAFMITGSAAGRAR